VPADVEPGLPDTQPAGHRSRDSLLELGHSFRRHHAADVVGTRPHQGVHRDLHIVGREHRVPVDADDDVVRRRPYPQVEPGAGSAGGVVDAADPGVAARDLGGHLVGAVGGGPHRHQQLERARVLLCEDVRHRAAQMTLLVEDRHHDRDAGPLARRGQLRTRGL
jgi:hypothetical protein